MVIKKGDQYKTNHLKPKSTMKKTKLIDLLSFEIYLKRLEHYG